MVYSDSFKETVNSVSAKEFPLLLLEVDHPDLAEPIHVVNDRQNFPHTDSDQWQANYTPAVNEEMVPVEYNGHYYKAITVVGPTDSTHPTLPIGSGATVVDGGVTWQESGYEYQALAFRLSLPDQPEHGLPRANIAVDNIGRVLTDWIESSGGGKGATARIMQVMRSNPGVIEWEWTLYLNNSRMTPVEVTGDLGYEDILNKPGIALSYRPDVAPGLY